MRAGPAVLSVIFTFAGGCNAKKQVPPAPPSALAAAHPHKTESEVFAPSQVVARLFGKEITAGEIGLGSSKELAARSGAGSGSDPDPLGRLESRIWALSARQYIDSAHLKATGLETGALTAFVVRALGPGTKSRQDELGRLERLIGTAGLPDSERELLELRRTVLAPASAEARDLASAAIVEASKLDEVLYRRFGGSVVLSQAGQIPLGARLALLRKHLQQKRIVVFDRRVDELLHRRLERVPAQVTAADQVDLTPFWKKAGPSGPGG